MSADYLAQAIADHFTPEEIFLLSAENDPYTSRATTAGRMLEVDGGQCACEGIDATLNLGDLEAFTLTGK